MGVQPAQDSAEAPGLDQGFYVGDVLHGAARGVVGAMAMTGMRVMTTELGLLEQTPPEAVSRQRARGLRALLRRAPRRQRTGLVEAAHWAFGAGGGAAFGTLPRTLRHRRWAGPLYGLVVWLGFELGIAPALKLTQSKRLRPIDRLALAADHLLYGVVISEPRRTREARWMGDAAKSGNSGRPDGLSPPKGDDMESDERKIGETHPDEPSGNGETTSEPYEPAQRDDKPRPAESKPSDESEEQAQRATDDGMSKRTEGRA